MNKQEITKYLENNEIDVQRAKASFLAASLVYDAYANSEKVHGFDYGVGFAWFLNSNQFNSYQSKEVLDGIAKKIYLDYLKNPVTLDEKIKNHQDLTKKMDDLWVEYGSVNKEDIQEMATFFGRFRKFMDEWWCYGVIGEEKGEVISREVVPHFQKRHNLIENKAQEIINILSHPKEKAVFNLEREDFLNLCLIILENKYLLDLLPDRKIEEIMKNKRMSKYVQKYLDDYFWFETNFYRVKKITLEDVFEKISTEIGLKSEERIKRELKAIKENFEKIEKSKKDLLNKMELTDEDGKDIYFVKRTVYWIDQRKLGMMKHLFYLFSFFEDVAKIKNIGYEELSFYLANELEELFLSDKRLSKEEIDKRKKGVFMAFVKNVEPKLFFGKDLEKFVIIVKNKNKKNSIKGVVTSMTRVEFVPMMRVARAVITNEGGIACHAAIVARELGIPAIIGTKIVTDVLKNGDGVEMNMKTGEVKILDG